MISCKGFHPAVLVDQTGSIIAVNGEWARRANDAIARCDSVGIGANYIRVCDESNLDDALSIAKGLRSVLNRQANEFVGGYRCEPALDAPQIAQIIAMDTKTDRFALVVHRPADSARPARTSIDVPDHVPLAELEPCGLIMRATPVALGCLRAVEAIPADAIGIGSSVAPELAGRLIRELAQHEPAHVQLFARDGRAEHFELHAWRSDPVRGADSSMLILLLPEGDAIDQLWLHLLTP